MSDMGCGMDVDKSVKVEYFFPYDMYFRIKRFYTIGTIFNARCDDYSNWDDNDLEPQSLFSNNAAIPVIRIKYRVIKMMISADLFLIDMNLYKSYYDTIKKANRITFRITMYSEDLSKDTVCENRKNGIDVIIPMDKDHFIEQCKFTSDESNAKEKEEMCVHLKLDVKNGKKEADIIKHLYLMANEAHNRTDDRFYNMEMGIIFTNVTKVTGDNDGNKNRY